MAIILCVTSTLVFVNVSPSVSLAVTVNSVMLLVMGMLTIFASVSEKLSYDLDYYSNLYSRDES
jgi:hypothetical protein